MTMNKTSFALSALSLVLLAGCGSSVSQVPEPNEDLMTIGKTTYTKGDVYELIKESDGADMLISMALIDIYNKEVPVDEEMEKEADEKYEALAANYEDILTSLKEAGYPDKQAYIDEILIPSVQSEKLTEKYFLENKDAIINEFEPSISQIIQTDSKENAEDALKALKDGKDVEEVVKEYGSETASFTGVEQTITTQNTTLPTRLINSLSSAKSDGVVDEVFENDDATSWYVGVVVSNNFEDNVSKYVETLSSDTDLSKEIVISYLSKYNFEVHDQFLFDVLKINNPEYLVTRPDLAEASE